MSEENQIVITFNIKDISLAYTIKKRIGFGNIYKIKNKNALNLIISNKNGIRYILNLITGKLKFENQLKNFNNLVLKYKYDIEITNETNNESLLSNHWLAGFSDADSSFQIKIINKKYRKKPEIRLNFQIDQKLNKILLELKNIFGGYVGEKKNVYYYVSTSFSNAKKVIDYFETFHLQSSKYLNFLKWCKAFYIIKRKDHLKIEGINKLIKIKRNMNDAKI